MAPGIDPGPCKAGSWSAIGHLRDGPKHHFGAPGTSEASFYSMFASVFLSFWNIFCNGLMSRKHAICGVSAIFWHPGGNHRERVGPVWRHCGTFGHPWASPGGPGSPPGTSAEAPGPRQLFGKPVLIRVLWLPGPRIYGKIAYSIDNSNAH